MRELILIAAATLVSEDLACIGAGMRVAAGALPFAPAVLACLAGIFAGDLLLYLAGRTLGRSLLAVPPLKWLVVPEQVDRGSRWLNRNGAAVVFSARFLPGMRLPTYFAAGLLKTRFLPFLGWFLLAAAAWTPLLVGLSVGIGGRLMALFRSLGAWAWAAGPLAALALYLLIRMGGRLATRRGRREIACSWLRMRRWEYWPPWIFYPPVAIYALRLGRRHRGLTVFTAANPGMPAGGFIAESKAAILAELARNGAPVARFARIPAGEPEGARRRRAEEFLRETGCGYPVVIKPDVGQRGSGVMVARTAEELEAALAAPAGDLIVQEYAAGPEFGLFYVRMPDEPMGSIFSVTEKHLPFLTGDGVRTLQDLILDDPALRGMIRFHLRRLAGRLDRVPPAGERIGLTDVGNHCRGAIFRDGGHLVTPALTAALDRAAKAHPGFHFGRFDVRAESVEALREGRAFKIVELNGVTSEATDIYDAKNSLFDAYRKLFAQWRLAFAVGAANRERGAVPATLRDLARLLRAYPRAVRPPGRPVGTATEKIPA